MLRILNNFNYANYSFNHYINNLFYNKVNIYMLNLCYMLIKIIL